MDVQIPDSLNGLDEASAELDRLMAAEKTDEGGEQKPDESANKDAADRAAAAGTEDVQKKNNDESDKGKAESGKQKTETAEKTDDGKGKAAAENKSAYAKAQERRDSSWKALNAEKDAFKSERDAFQKEREQFQREREQYQQERTKAEDEFSPDQYDEAAKKFEADGKFELADLAKRKAEQLRKNPPQKGPDKTEAARKEWTLKAGMDFPELAKQNSPLQVRVAQLLKEEPDFSGHPKGIYVAARIASLENEAAKYKADAEALPKKDEELKQLKARVQELEALTAPGGEGGAQHLPGAKTFEQMSEAEQFAALQDQARQVGVLTR